MGSQEQNYDLETPGTCSALFQLCLDCIFHLLLEVLQILELHISASSKLPPLFTFLGYLGPTGSKGDDLTGMLWELLVSVG